jgi:drug/metabolite transporter (DMT)-like permease
MNKLVIKKIEKKSVSEKTLSKISMLLSATCMGFVGIFVDLLAEFPIYTTAFFRGLFGTLFLIIPLMKSQSFSLLFLKKIFKHNWKLLLGLLFVSPITIYLYFLNISLSGYAIAAFLLYTNGIFLLIFLSLSSEKHYITKKNILSFILAFLGVLLIMEIWKGELMLNTALIGLTSGVILAIQVFLKKKIYEKKEQYITEATQVHTIDMFLAWWYTLTLIIFFLPLGVKDIVHLTGYNLLFGLLLGLIPTALAFILYNKGIKNDKGGDIFILSYFEPVIATINTAIFQLQNLSLFTILGGILILVANFIILKSSKPFSNKILN